MFVRLKIEGTREGLVATISQRDDDGKITGRPSIFLVEDKEEAKQRAKAGGASLGVENIRCRRQDSQSPAVTDPSRLIDLDRVCSGGSRLMPEG